MLALGGELPALSGKLLGRGGQFVLLSALPLGPLALLVCQGLLDVGERLLALGEFFGQGGQLRRLQRQLLDALIVLMAGQPGAASLSTC